MKNIVAMVCLLLAFFGPASVSAQPTPLAAQTSRGGGITVKVTPKDLAAEARRWEFKVVLDTHSADLSQDLVKSAVMIDAAGRFHAPLAWDGASPRGHHREGVLSFKPLGAVDEVTLQLRDVGMPERVFRWSLNGQAR